MRNTTTIAILALTGAIAMAAPTWQAAALPARAHKAASAGFPYLRWPATFVAKDAPVVQPVGHFRFWDGSALQDVEGRTYLVTLVGRDGGSFDAPLLRRTIEGDLARLYAVRIASGHVPQSVIATINDADRKALAPGLGNIGNDPVETWTLHRPHRQIWFQFTQEATQASLAVVEAKLN